MKLLKTKSYHKGEKKWFAIDATGLRLGRVASLVASMLKGKHNRYFTPHADQGDYIIVFNISKIKCTSSDKIYYRHSGRMGGLKQRTYQEQMQVSPEKVFTLAVKRMISNTPLGREMLRKLHCYAGSEHPHAAQQPTLINFEAREES